ncbi:MAG: SpoIID/LytB domain-containing protein [Tissierellaceae bacterium]
MKRICFFIVLLMTIGSISHTVYGYDLRDDYIDVRVGIKNIDESIMLSSSRGFYLYDKKYMDEIMDIDYEIILIKGNRNGSIDILDEDGDEITTLDEDDSIIIGSQDRESIIQVDKNRFRDYIYFFVRDNKLYIINHIYMEHYLYGVVPKEIPASASIEALKAQAVIARSYAYTSLSNHKSDGYNLCNTTHCQVYGGVDGEKSSTNQAVIETYGDYVSYDGKIINTPYHSNSGGYTEDGEKVWGGKAPYLLGVEDIYSNNSPNSSWTTSITSRELSQKLLQSGIDVGNILDIEIIEKTDSKRVKDMRIIGSKKEETISGDKFRSILGATYLKSTLFNVGKSGSSSSSMKTVYAIDAYSNYPKKVDLGNIYILDSKGNQTVNRGTVRRVTGNNESANIGGTFTSSDDVFILEGKGYGHGVGMSQYGAMEMANQGFDYEDIIKHYYTGVEIINKGK